MRQRVFDPHGCADVKLPAHLDPRNDLTGTDLQAAAAALSDQRIEEICSAIGALLGKGPGAERD